MNNSYVSDELYNQVTASFPIVCIDVIPYDPKTNRIGVIIRATGKESGKMAVIGGRIQKNESIKQAISRHLATDLQLEEFTFYKGNTEARPFYIQQYVHGDTATNSFTAYDPSKHSIGLTYIIHITDMPKPTSEAAAFHWIAQSEIPSTSAYNQHILMHEAFAFIGAD